MNKRFRLILNFLIIITMIFNFLVPVYAAPGGKALKLIDDKSGHNALYMTVTPVPSTSPLQAFCVGWQFEFSNEKGSISVSLDLLEVKTTSGSKDFTFALTSEYIGLTSGIKGFKSIRDAVSDKATFDKIVKQGCTVTANAIIRKYSYTNGKLVPTSTYAYSREDIDDNFGEFTDNFKDNTKDNYFELTVPIPPEKVPAPEPHVEITQPQNGLTVLRGKTVTFKGWGTGVHHIGGFVDDVFLEEQGNPSDDYNDKMWFETTVKLDELGPHTFYLLGRNAATGGKTHKSNVHTVYVIDPPANSGTIYVKGLDIDTNKEISEASCEIPGVEYNKPKTVTYTPVAQYKVQGSYQTFSTSVPDKSKMETATTQTVTLSSSNNKAYVYFWYKVDNTVPTPKPPEKVNENPIAIIINPAVAYAGDDVIIDGSRSYDFDGYVERWIWDIPGTYGSDPDAPWVNELNNPEQDIEKGTAWYPKIGVYPLGLEVVDDGNCSGYDQSMIEIIEPKPEVNIDVLADKMKENRKITLDTSKSKSATRYPIDWSLTTWKIEPIPATGATSDYGVRFQDGTVYKNVNNIAYLYKGRAWQNTGIAFNFVLTGQKTVQFQARDSGQYKITVSITNTYMFNSAVHYSNTLDRTITVVEDLAPVASFNGSDSNIREFENPIDKTLQRYGVIPVQCTTSSPDGDPIGRRIWSLRYDSDNDRAQGASISEAFADEATIYPYTGNEPFTSGIRLIVDGDKDDVAEIWTYDVGKYTESLQAFEDIPDSETVKELLVPSDFKSSYVQGW